MLQARVRSRLFRLCLKTVAPQRTHWARPCGDLSDPLNQVAVMTCHDEFAKSRKVYRTILTTGTFHVPSMMDGAFFVGQ